MSGRSNEDILIAEAAEKTPGKPRGRQRKNIKQEERNGPKAEEDVYVDTPKVELAEPKELAPDSNGLIRVRGRVAEDKFALLEVHEAHPDGAVRLKGTEEADVWPTQRVMDAMYKGRLERV